MKVMAVPVDESGSAIEDDFVDDDPYSLVGKKIAFQLKIVAAWDLPAKYRNTYCRYDLANHCINTENRYSKSRFLDATTHLYKRSCAFVHL